MLNLLWLLAVHRVWNTCQAKMKNKILPDSMEHWREQKSGSCRKPENIAEAVVMTESSAGANHAPLFMNDCHDYKTALN
jgi:hypothetical protein